jgi:hypothetical protein
MKSILVLLFIFLANTCLAAQEHEVNDQWVQMDVVFIESLKRAYAEHPQTVVEVLQPEKKARSALGFGYSMVHGSAGKGYVATYYSLIYKGDKLVGYELNQQMPDDKRLRARYTELYAGLFEVEGEATKLKYYNYEQMTQPLTEHNRALATSDEFNNYMTPFSGIVYGERGGYANSLIENWKNYLALKPELSPVLYEQLLYSKNPATRLVAVAYFYTRPALDKAIAQRIEAVLTDLPEVQTMSGCSLHSEPARKLVRPL